MKFKIIITFCVAAFSIVAVIVANPACTENDSMLAQQVYESCLKNTWMSQQCRRTANEVTCKRWAYWLSR